MKTFYMHHYLCIVQCVDEKKKKRCTLLNIMQNKERTKIIKKKHKYTFFSLCYICRWKTLNRALPRSARSDLHTQQRFDLRRRQALMSRRGSLERFLRRLNESDSNRVITHRLCSHRLIMPFKIASFLLKVIFGWKSLFLSVINGPMTSQTGSGNDKFQEPIKTSGFLEKPFYYISDFKTWTQASEPRQTRN